MTAINMTRRHKKGISTVLTTLIIVVASVVLGTAVTLFGTSLFQTGAQSQGISASQANIWFRADCGAVSNPAEMVTVGSVVVRNSGDKLMAIDTIKIRGTIVPNGNWWANTTASSAQTQAAMIYQSSVWEAACNALPGASVTVGTSPTAVALAQQSGPVSLDPGKTAIIYFVGPGSYDTITTNDVLTSTDVGAAVSLTVQAGQLTAVQSVGVAKV